jgi:Acetyltransferase (GNAT) domain
MSLEIHRTTPAEIDALATLLISVFNAAPDAVFANEEVLRWKYFESGPRWEGSRSYLLTKEDRIQAHCAVWPLNLHFSGQRVTCNCFIDWASTRDLPGAGFMLQKKLLALSETSIVVGGSADTRAIVPRLGFGHVSEVTLFARVVRPWRQFRNRPPEAVWKQTARLLRNTMWSRSLVGSVPDGWTAVRVDSFLSASNCDAHSTNPMPWRDSSYLNYWLRCPATKILGYEILNHGSVEGHFLLSHVRGQTRIADIRLCSEEIERWTIAYRLGTIAAAELPETCEVLAVASTPFAAESLLACGFRDRGSVPLFLYDPQKKLAAAPPIFWNMIEGDAAYLEDSVYPYVS